MCCGLLFPFYGLNYFIIGLGYVLFISALVIPKSNRTPSRYLHTSLLALLLIMFAFAYLVDIRNDALTALMQALLLPVGLMTIVLSIYIWRTENPR
jgi:hypothetical protein